uniref:Ras GTPase-activating protein n=2 Tax=Amphimedon queenslandica TaxID=400682 RepID=A0A1X7U651_AMPQE
MEPGGSELDDEEVGSLDSRAGSRLMDVEGDAFDADALSDDVSDTGWETDLEIEEEKEKYDATGQKNYVKACDSIGIVPASHFMRCLSSQEPSIDLSHHYVGAKGAKAIAVALISNTTVTNLNLSYNGLCPEGGVAIIDMLKENCYITHLDLSNNGIAATGAVMLLDILASNTTVTHLNLSGSSFDDKAAEPLSEIIKSSIRVTHLNLSHNELSEASGVLIGAALAESEVLQHLDLSWNYLRRKGAVAIAQGLKPNQMLKKLNLSYNGFGTEGAVALADSLKINTTLTHLDITDNRILIDGVRAIAKVLQTIDSLQSLKIGHNPIQIIGVIALLEALKNGTSSVKYLGLDGITVTLNVAKIITEMQEEHTGLVITTGGTGGYKEPRPLPTPVEKLFKYSKENNIRLSDLFIVYDKKKRLFLTEADFRASLKHISAPLMEFEVLKLLNEFGRKATKEDFAAPAAPEGEEGGGGGGGGEGEEGEGVEEYSDADLEELKIVEYRLMESKKRVVSNYRSSIIGPPVFQYTSIYAKISEAKNLASGLRDVYCYIKVDNEAIARTASVFNSSEPFWGEEYRLHVPLEYQYVSVYLYDHDTLGVKVPIGKVRLDRDSIMGSPRGLDSWFPLKPISKDDEIQGELLAEIMIDEYSDEMFRGVITLVEARDLAVRDINSKVDPYAVINYKGKELNTPTLKKTRFPRWNKTYELPINRPLEEFDNRTVRITIYDSAKFHHDAFLGEVIIDLAELFLGQRYKTWYRLQQQDKETSAAMPSGGAKKDGKKEKDLGSLRLKVQCHEERILDSQLYSPFVQLMISAVESPGPEGSPLLIMLEEVMTMDRNSLAQTLVRFYIAHNAILPLFDCLISREVENVSLSNVTTLFRGNSLASKCLDQFMKVVALPYLHETLKPVIDTIFNDKKLVELDPDQLKTRSSSTSKLIDTSVAQLTGYIQIATESIFESVERCPQVLRQSMRLLWDRVIVKFPDGDTPYSSVTGFIFLRFFVPAILSPKLFALREEHADQRAERTLKLTAKLIQTMGNLQTAVDAKEQFMSPMATLLKEGVDKVKTYINQLIDVQIVMNTPSATPVEVLSDGLGYLQHVVLNSGVLWKRVTSGTSGAVGSLLYRKRFFELTNIAFTYFPTEKKTGEAKSYPVQWIRVVEKLDEAAFSRKHMFQIVIVPVGPSTAFSPSETVLYLQAADVNEQNRWVSAIRKACLCNREMSPVHHTGVYLPRKKEWSCCRATAPAEPGCCPCHRGITIGDWRDPLDPYLDAQVLYSQYQQGRETLTKNYSAPAESENPENPDVPPPRPAKPGSDEARMQAAYGRLAEVLDELSYHHSQVPNV